MMKLLALEDFRKLEDLRKKKEDEKEKEGQSGSAEELVSSIGELAIESARKGKRSGNELEEDDSSPSKRAKSE
jgi:hypothetical protein